MKKLFTYLLFVALALISTECKVSNVEPVPLVSESDDDTKVIIYGTPVLKNNVKLIDKNSLKEIISVTDKTITFKGLPKFQSGRMAAGRIGATEEDGLKAGDIIAFLQENTEVVALNGKVIAIKKSSIDIQNNNVVEYETINEWSFSDLFRTLKGRFEKQKQINKNINIEEAITVGRKKESTTSGIKIKQKVSLTSIIQENWKFTIDVDIEDNTVNNFKILATRVSTNTWSANIQGKIEWEKTNYEQKLPPIPFNLPIPTPSGIPILIPMTVEPKYEVNFRVEGDLNLIGVIVPRKETRDTIGFVYGKTFPSGKALLSIDRKNWNWNLAGNGKIGIFPKFSFEFRIARFSIPSLKIELGLFFGGEIACNNGNQTMGIFIEPRPKILLKLSMFKGRFDPELKLFEFPNDLVKLSLFEIPIGNNIACEPPVLTDATEFRVYLATNNFPIHFGTSPPSLQESATMSLLSTIWRTDNVKLKKSNYSPDAFDVNRINGLVRNFFTFSQQTSTTVNVETEQRDNSTRTDRYNIDNASRASITGKDGYFTIIGKCSGKIMNSGLGFTPNYVNEFAISGKKDGNIITDIHYAFRVNDVTNCGDGGQCLPEGTFRYFTAPQATLIP